MKYSREKQKYHLEIITGMMSEEQGRSSRAIWRDLRHKGIFLDRGYVSKLVAQAYVKWASEERGKRIRETELTEWQQEAKEIVNSFYRVISTHLIKHPYLHFDKNEKKS